MSTLPDTVNIVLILVLVGLPWRCGFHSIVRQSSSAYKLAKWTLGDFLVCPCHPIADPTKKFIFLLRSYGC
jgi:hypothetical protein